MLNEFFETSFQKLNGNSTLRYLSFLFTAALGFVLKATLFVISVSPTFPTFLFASFVVLAGAFLLELVAIFDYLNSKYGWLPDIKIRG
jgi:hypothetical protein